MIPKPALPAPDPASAAHCRRVSEHIGRMIDAGGGDLSFATFMHEALYAPGLGYYGAGTRKFGVEGDFVTAPEISPLFGFVIARQLAGVLRETGGDLLEFGAGTGSLAVALLGKLAALDVAPSRYRILEVSPELRLRQQQRIAADIPALADRVEWIDDIPASFSGVIVANEVLDAMPVERFRIEQGRVRQARVFRDGDEFRWRFAEAPPILERAVRQVEAGTGIALPDGYESEVAPAIANWVRDLGTVMDCGTVLIIDYGVPRREYYAADRGAGWLRCHYRHHVHADPLILAGIQDITAWIDFTSVADAAVASGFNIAGYANQGQFLVHGGLHLELGDFMSLPERRQVELSGQVKLLTLPAEMGENFKVMALSKGGVEALPAFAECDAMHRL